MVRQERSLEAMYGDEDLAKSPIFPGGFLNFGYWTEKSDHYEISDRIRASQTLYQKVFEVLELQAKDSIVEVGSGRGLGLALAAEQFQPKSLIGVDASEAQVVRAKTLNPALNFLLGTAEGLPLATESISKCYSVEAAQHFIDFGAFSNQVFRVLKPGGKLVVSTFFLRSPSHQEKLAELIPTVRDKIDRVISIGGCRKFLRNAGLVGVSHKRIGKNVWKSFDRWIVQAGEKEDWGRNWFKAYQKGLIDYYIVQAKKP